MSEIAKQKLHWFGHMTEEVLILRQLCAEPVPRVLDFGCNWGKWASMALAHGCEVLGVDVNRDAAVFCARRGIHIISFDEIKSWRFDFINVDQVLEHLAAPVKVARELAEALNPGGIIKISTPASRNLPRLLAEAQRSGDDRVVTYKTLDPLLPLAHVNLFTAAALKEVAGKAGLRPFRIPFLKSLGAGQLWNLPRQFNRNLVTPWKRWRGRGTYQWFEKR